MNHFSVVNDVTHLKPMIMKYLFVIAMFFASAAYAQQPVQPTDEDLIKQVINTAYIDGIQNNGNVEDIRKGFHPSFNMLRMTDNEIKPYSIADWIAAIEQKKKDGLPNVAPATGKFINVDITGTAAVVKLELYRQDKKTFTDYLVLYKFTEGWRIVSKTFFRHPN
jgi:hypothetical protein